MSRGPWSYVQKQHGLDHRCPLDPCASLVLIRNQTLGSSSFPCLQYSAAASYFLNSRRKARFLCSIKCTIYFISSAPRLRLIYLGLIPCKVCRLCIVRAALLLLMLDIGPRSPCPGRQGPRSLGTCAALLSNARRLECDCPRFASRYLDANRFGENML